MLISKFADGNVNERVNEMEKKYIISLPNQYKDFLCKYNGGYTPKTKFKVGKISSDIRGFYGVGNVKLSFDTIQMREWVDNSFLPIATDSFGNYLLIGLENDSNGKIFFCNHEEGNKVECIADNLKDFFKYCKSEKISEASRLSIKEREDALIARVRGAIITDALRQMWQAEIDKYENMIQEEVIID